MLPDFPLRPQKMGRRKDRRVDSDQPNRRFFPRRPPKRQTQNPAEKKLLQQRHEHSGEQRSRPDVGPRKARPNPHSEKALQPGRCSHHSKSHSPPKKKAPPGGAPIPPSKKPLGTILPEPKQTQDERQSHPHLHAAENAGRSEHSRHHSINPQPDSGKKNSRQYQPEAEEGCHSFPSTVHRRILSKTTFP